MAEIIIRVSEGYDTCEDCGMYDYEEVKVSYGDDPDSIIMEHTGDSHLGGGMWYDWKDAVREVLTALGHDVQIIEEE